MSKLIDTLARYIADVRYGDADHYPGEAWGQLEPSIRQVCSELARQWIAEREQ